MKKSLITFGIASLGLVVNASAQGVNDGDNARVDVDVTSKPFFPEKFLKYDTISYLSDPIQNIFVSAKVGGSYSLGENTRFADFFEMVTPSVEISVGKVFYPQFAARVAFSFLNQRGRAMKADFYKEYGKYDGEYTFSILGGHLDGLINFTNIFMPYNENRRFNLIGILGLGSIYTLNFDMEKLDYYRKPTFTKAWDSERESDRYSANGGHYNVGDYMPTDFWYAQPQEYDKVTGEAIPRATKKNRWYFAGRMGLMANIMLNDRLDLDVEATFEATDDAYNGVRFRRVYDGYVNLMVGVTYHIADFYGQRRIRYVNYVDQNKVDCLNRELVDSEAKVRQNNAPRYKMRQDVAYNEMLKTTVSFYIDKTFITEAQKRNVRSVAQFLKSHPDLDLVVTGYADAETAYPKYNMMLSEKRAKNVYNLLISEYGVEPNRLSLDFKGDVEQPFATVNEWNRAVVFIIKPHDARFKATVKEGSTTPSSAESRRLNDTDYNKTRRP